MERGTKLPRVVGIQTFASGIAVELIASWVGDCQSTKGGGSFPKLRAPNPPFPSRPIPAAPPSALPPFGRPRVNPETGRSCCRLAGDRGPLCHACAHHSGKDRVLVFIAW